MKGTAARSKCAACIKGHKHCDLLKPCFACRLSASKCRYERQAETRPLPDVIDRLEYLAERLCDTGDAEYSSEEDVEDSNQACDPEFGVKRIRMNPMDDLIYTSHPSRQACCADYIEMIGKYMDINLMSELREISTTIYVEFTQMGFNLYPLNKPFPPPQHVDLAPYINRVVTSLRDEYQLMDRFLRNLLPEHEFGDFTKFSPDCGGPRAAIYYGTIAFVLSRYVHKDDFTNNEVQQVLRWATVNAAKLCFKNAILPASIDALRAILIVFASNSEHWLGADALNNLSRIAMGLCRDLGLNRDYIYKRIPRKQRHEWNVLFWISYFFNRSLSIRWGWFPAVEANEISPVAIDLAGYTDFMGIKQAVELFSIYDEMYEFMSSPAAETRPARQLVSKSLRYLGKLEKWWNKTYPLVAIGATVSVLDKIDEVYYDELEVRVVARWTVTTFLYLRMSIFQSCALSSISTHEHLTGMYPDDVAYLEEHCTPSTQLQGRIASLLQPHKSLQKAAFQGIILATNNLPSREICVKNLYDCINFLGAITTSVIDTHTISAYELECCKDLETQALNEFGSSRLGLIRALLAYIKTSTRVIENFGKLFLKDTTFMPGDNPPYIERPPQEFAEAGVAPPMLAARGFPDQALAEFFF